MNRTECEESKASVSTIKLVFLSVLLILTPRTGGLALHGGNVEGIWLYYSGAF